MKFTRILTAIAITALLLTACNKAADVSTNTHASPLPVNPLLAFAPADTPYVFAALKPAPRELTEAYMARIQPAFDLLTNKIARFQTAFAAGEHEHQASARVASAILDELGGTINARSLEKLGISLQAHHAIYGMGIFPVIRLELKDAQALRAAIARIETKIGFELPLKEFNGTAYWRLNQSDQAMGLYIAIVDQQLVLGIFPVNAESRLLATFLGQKMPAQSIASDHALARLNRDKGYTDFDSGIIDLRKVADELLSPDSATRAYLGPEAARKMISFAGTCGDEIKAMLAKTPRITVGTTSLTTNEASVRLELEMESTLAAALSGIVSESPVAGTEGKLLNASLALNIGRLHAFLLDQANALVAAPFQCTYFHDLNHSAQQMAQQLNIPMPPMVNNLMGARISINRINPQASVPIDGGLAAVFVDQPQMFVGMANMMIPGFDNLDLANQSEPVKIPANMLPLQNRDVFALMGDNAIGFALGEQNTTDLKPFMAARSQADGTFFSVSYDLSQLLQLQHGLLDKLTTAADNTPGKATPDKHAQALAELQQAVREAYLSGTTRVEMKFAKGGLVIDHHMTFE